MKIKQLQFGLLLTLAFLFCLSSLKAQQREEKQNRDTISSSPVAEDQNKVYDKPEVKASIDSLVWRKHLSKQLSQFLLQPSSANIPPGKYTVKVRFIVETDGSLSQMKAMDNPGYGLAEAAIKVIQASPKWKAAEQGGNKVRSYRVQPISFFIQNKNPSTS